MKIISLLAAATLGLTLCACGGSSGTAGVPSTGIPSSVQLTAVGFSPSVFAPAQGVLRPDDPPASRQQTAHLAPQPGVDQLSALIQAATASDSH